jgi:DNA-binding NtrC family response regulator
MKILTGEPWPGNVRQVSGVVVNLVAWKGEPVIDTAAVRRALTPSEHQGTALEAAVAHFRRMPLRERKSPEVLAQALEHFKGRGVEAAQALGIPLRTFRRLQRLHGLTRRDLLGIALDPFN